MQLPYQCAIQIELSSIYKSPVKDFGYDIEDFRDIAPIFGTLENFNRLATVMKH
jgi:Glycosidases